MGSSKKFKVRLVKIIQAFFYVVGILFCIASIVGLAIGAETVAWTVVGLLMGIGFVAAAIIIGDQIISKITSNNEQSFTEIKAMKGNNEQSFKELNITKTGGIISQQDQQAKTRNFSEMYPELQLMRSCLLPQVDEGFPDKKNIRIKYIRRPLVICLLISVVVGILGLIIEDLVFFFICFGISLGCSIYLGLFITLSAWNNKIGLIRNSELSKATDYFQPILGKQEMHYFRVKNHLNNALLIVVKDKKFGVWNFFSREFIIQPKYDYLKWSVTGKVLNAKMNGESFDITIQGQRLY